MPTFTPQPCSLTPKDCRLLYHDTDIESVDDRELLKQCGSPAHLDDDSAQCLIGGGPVELIYFPVERDNSSLCTNKTSSGPVSLRPLMPGVSEITTLGHTFSSNSVYVSFKTLYASYDGFWDKIGPTFSDYIVPLQSSDISTHCGGWWGAVHNPIGTALTYADLNWPVAASAYSCQNRCSDTFSRSYSLDKGIIGAQLVSIASPPQCSTIWSDVNPVLAFPTKIRDMVPEWKSCSFWNENLANFWFDPPIALQPASAAATPTLPTSPKSTAAAAAPTPTSPTASSTVSHLGPTETHTQSATQSEAHSPQQTTIEASNAVPDTTTERQDDPIITTSGDASVHTTQVPQFSFSFDPEEPTLTSSGDIIIPTTQASQVSFTLDPEDPTDAASNGAQSIVHTNPSDGNTQGATILDPSIATAPAFSILTEALSTFASAETATRETPTTPGATGVLLSFESFTATLLQTSDHYVLGLATLTVGQTATVSSVPVVAGPDGIIIGSSTALVSELSPSQTLQPSMPSLTFAPSPTVIQAGEILLTPIDAGWNIITFASTEITRSGAAISSGDAIITYGPNGLVLVSSGSTVPFTEVDQTTAAEKTLVADLGSTTQTLTATAVGSGNALDGDVLQVGTQTISRNGGVAVNDATTYSYGSEGLEIIASNTQLTMQTLGVKSNATSASLPIVVMSTSSSSTTESRYWPTETAVSTTTASGAASSRSIWRLSCVLASLWFFFQQLDGV
ncbi:hypothetical protein HII31_12302 [Pseudocercospora fuligena]|uniref:Uncharacterized protein n=1 Tax=Pseudocercospora fuligena TaxID=685502 RepID=A0A8H6R879_9PEZI|nr:hypothetical protein HII31_12302 [Pseudocercospora fuligena]